jgi:hypothetical protein
MNLRSLLSLMIACVSIGAVGTSGVAQPLQIAGSGGSVRIACTPDKDVVEMGRYLQRFLRDRGFAVQSEIAEGVQDSYSGPQWILSIDRARFARKAKDEAFVLSSAKGSHGPIVELTGKTPCGLRAAVARLLGKIANDGSVLWLEAGREVVDPFIKQRLMNIGQAARRQAPPGSPFAEVNYETWDPQRIRAYPEMVWHLGFNGVQVDECRGYGSVTGDELVRVRKAVRTVSEGAHDWHLFVSLSQWGDVLFHESVTSCWNDPKDHETMLKFIDDLAKAYGPYVDNITCRFCDPGGCTSNGCDLYKTPQLVTTAYLNAFRKMNPKTTGTLSLWANSTFWRYSPKPVDLANYSASFRDLNNHDFGYQIADGAQFLDSTFMPVDVGIALHKFYISDQGSLIAAAGRPVDIKGWYVGDMEMNDNICINVTEIDGRFNNMPEDARDRVRMQTIDMCFHGWPQVINQYVAVQKLIDPKRPLRTIMHEFCTAAFGPQNADAMVDVYFACENGIEHVPTSAIAWPSDFGSAAHNIKLRGILVKADAVKLVPGWKPNFAFPVPAQKYVDMLRARLGLTLAVSEAKEEVDKARANGADDKKIGEIKQKALDALPKLPIDPIYSQDSSVVAPNYRTDTFADMIQKL